MARVFIAVDLPAEIRSALKELQQQLRPFTNAARWVAPESIHITLKFIGEVSEARIAEIHTALLGLEGEPFPITVRSVGFFPNPRSPRVFWAGLDAAALPRLAENVETRMARIGFEREKRAFQPHVTLARARETRIDSSLVAAAAKYSEQIFGTFIVDRVFLVQSTLKPSGAIYNKLKEYRLAIQ
jgi:RNA 2',3'-cyclic 3'-phosphodiesterase